MASKFHSRGGMSSREKVRLVVMASGVVIIVAIVVGSLSQMGGGGRTGEGLTVVDPDAQAVLPDYDRGILASVVDGADPTRRESWVPILDLLAVKDGDHRVFEMNGRGVARLDAAVCREDPASIRGDYVKFIGRVTGGTSHKVTEEGPVTLPAADARGPVVFRYELEDNEGGKYVVYSDEAAPDEGGRVLKVIGWFLRRGVPAADGEVAPCEVVSIHLIPSVFRERFEHLDPSWFRLVRDATIEEREDLRTPAIFLTLAWATTLGPDGFAERLEQGTLRAEDMPDADEIHKNHAKLQGRIFRIKGELQSIRGDHAVGENRSGLESVYRLEVLHDLGPKKVFPVVVLAGLEALPEGLRAGDRVALEGVYVKIWTKSDAQGRLVLLPLLVAPRVKIENAPDTEER